jgi:hypothetical protein
MSIKFEACPSEAVRRKAKRCHKDNKEKFKDKTEENSWRSIDNAFKTVFDFKNLKTSFPKRMWVKS